MNGRKRADEMFCGYRSYLSFDRVGLPNYVLKPVVRASVEPLLSKRARAEVEEVEEVLSGCVSGLPGTDDWTKLRMSELHQTLEPLLRRADHALMRHSVEGRTPFLHGDAPRVAFRLTLRQCLHDGQTKVALRKAYADHLPRHFAREVTRGHRNTAERLPPPHGPANSLAMVELQPSTHKEDPLGITLTICGFLVGVGVTFMLAKWDFRLALIGWAMCWGSAGATIYLYRDHLLNLLQRKFSVHQILSISLMVFGFTIPPIIFFTDPSLRYYQLFERISGVWGDRDCNYSASFSASPASLTIKPMKHPAGADARPKYARVTGVGDMTVNTQDVSQSANGASPGARFTLHTNGSVWTLEWADFNGPPRILNRC